MNIHEFPEKLAVVKLGPGAEIPAWAESSSLFQITATATATIVVCARRDVPRKAEQRGPFVAFRVEQKFTGELPAGAVLLSAYDEDWVLVPVADAEASVDEWRRRGDTVSPAVPA